MLYFPHVCRFYFVGDEDLLEIIGNSKNIPKLQRHFKNMFGGVASVFLDNDNWAYVLGEKVSNSLTNTFSPDVSL